MKIAAIGGAALLLAWMGAVAAQDPAPNAAAAEPAATQDESAAAPAAAAPAQSEISVADSQAEPAQAETPAADPAAEPARAETPAASPAAEPAPPVPGDSAPAPEVVATIPVKSADTPEPVKKGEEPIRFDEITVTATKRVETERSVSGAVTAMTGEHLAEIGAVNFKDYLTLIPGVQFNEADPGYSLVTMRGVSTTNDVQQNQTPVGIFYNEVPLTDPFGAIQIPDIDTFDMKQVEVMRGPQGALFGAGALGGAINYIPRAPEANAFDAALDLSANIGHDRQLGKVLKGMVNVPLISDQLAVRAVGYTTHIPGYLSNIGTGVKDSNTHQFTGVRGAVGWTPDAATTISVGGLYQRTFIGDIDYQTTTYGELNKASNFPESGVLHMDMEDLHLEHDFGFARLVGIAAYQHKDLAARQDASYSLPSIVFASGLPYDLTVQALSTLGPVEGDLSGALHGTTGELRLVSPNSDRFEWLVGGYYGKRGENLAQRQFLQNLGALNGPLFDVLTQLLGPQLSSSLLPALAPYGNLVVTQVQLQSREIAAYLDGTFKFSPAWKVEAGGRAFWNRIDSLNHIEGPLSLASTSSQSISSTREGVQSARGFNPKASLTWTPGKDWLFYLLYARGFTLGGVNVVPPEPNFEVPPSYGPNQLHNFELGIRSSWLNDQLLVDLTPYYMKWQDIPLELLSPMGRPYLDNVGDALNYGLEISITARPAAQLTLTSAITLLRAKLLDPYDPSGGGASAQAQGQVLPGLSPKPIPAGTPLPGASNFQIGNQVLYNWYRDSGRYHLVLLHRYTGRAPGSLQHPEFKQGNFHVFGLRGGWSLNGISADLQVNNVFDRHGISRTTFIVNDRLNQSVIQPRTIGLELGWSFR